MPVSHPTIRTIAAALGLSRSTVSNALRGLPGVNATTRQRVQDTAAAIGYSPHPFATQVMSQLRRKSATKQVGTLGVLEIDEPGRPPGAVMFNQNLLESVIQRASAMGFTVSHWKFGLSEDVTLKRLDQILHWRGIRGLLLMPTWSEPDFSALDWTRYTGVYIDYFIQRPVLHTVCSDHFRTLFTALEKARELGYRKPGFAVAQRANDRVHGRWIGAYLSYLHDRPEMTAVPPLIVDVLRPENFLPWFRERRPDIVITHWIGAPAQMIAAGADIPRREGYICLNVLPAPVEYSGFTLQPKLLGVRATELVISQLEHGESGIPLAASTTLVPALWVEGSTVRRRI